MNLSPELSGYCSNNQYQPVWDDQQAGYYYHRYYHPSQHRFDGNFFNNDYQQQQQQSQQQYYQQPWNQFCNQMQANYYQNCLAESGSNFADHQSPNAAVESEPCETPALKALLTNPAKKLKYEPNYYEGTAAKNDRKVPDFEANSPPLSPIEGLAPNTESLLGQDWSNSAGMASIKFFDRFYFDFCKSFP